MKFRCNNLLACAALAIACVTGVGTSQAGVNMYTNQASFSAQGTIAYNSNFNDFASGFGSPGNPFTRGDVTYTSLDNLTVAPDAGYFAITVLMTNNYWSPITGDINSAPKYDMFGYDIGVLARQDQQTLVVTTNLNSYSFGPLTITDGTQGLEFRGFITDSPAEYFTGFSITSQNGSGSLPGITNVQVGNTGVRPEGVPEPGSLIVFGALGAIGMVVGYRRKQVA